MPICMHGVRMTNILNCPRCWDLAQIAASITLSRRMPRPGTQHPGTFTPSAPYIYCSADERERRDAIIASIRFHGLGQHPAAFVPIAKWPRAVDRYNEQDFGSRLLYAILVLVRYFRGDRRSVHEFLRVSICARRGRYDAEVVLDDFALACALAGGGEEYEEG